MRSSASCLPLWRIFFTWLLEILLFWLASLFPCFSFSVSCLFLFFSLSFQCQSTQGLCLVIFSSIAWFIPLMILFHFMTFNSIYMLMIPKCISTVQTLVLNSRIVYPVAPILSPLECLIDITNSVSPKLNSWGALLNLLHSLFSLSVLMAIPSLQLCGPINSLDSFFSDSSLRSGILSNLSLISVQNMTPPHQFHGYHPGLNSIRLLDYSNNLLTGVPNFTLVLWQSVLKAAFIVISLSIASYNVSSLLKSHILASE